MSKKRRGIGAEVGQFGRETQLGQLSAELAVEQGMSERAAAVAVELQFVWAREQMGVGDHRPVRITGLCTFTPMMKRINRTYSKKAYSAQVFELEMLRAEAEQYWAVLDGVG